MKKNRFVAGLLVLSANAAFAQQPPADAPKPPLGFFVTSSGSGKGADLGGLAGADAHCQKLAGEVGAGSRNWKAYLSTQADGSQPAVNARDRIGKGPWANAAGTIIANDLAHLHGDTVELGQLGNNVHKKTTLTEKGTPINGVGDTPNQHDIITGSQPDGRAYTDAADHTCKNYTSSGEGSVRVGHSDRTNGGRTGGNVSWNSTHDSRGCSQENLVSTGGNGYFYCFAAD
ncbi:lectin [Methylomonas sp. SURF-2]|uniref:Lectin n=1 Tax=Methylomonas subterranea TaxID=2952225 RepID=A0ABT1TL76_9GAMM|nr:lectin [Methylomonas sp. SURF-2]MCQ8106208.1 lectin [Methylomonas sp. SURF-2]